ncbi:MAG: DUF4832 domain-containing protein [Clostridiales bacterium]|nr:DUF4832 domain-containing protein [Clostridiales bacterium]
MEKWKNDFLSLKETEALGINVNPHLFKNSKGEEIKLSIYDIIKFHLGYQLAITECSANNGILNLAVTNYGFAAPHCFNYFAVIFKEKKSGDLLEQEIKNYDKESLQPKSTVKYKINIPENFEPLGVKMDAFKNNGVYVRFANSAEFENGIQHFN